MWAVIFFVDVSYYDVDAKAINVCNIRHGVEAKFRMERGDLRVVIGGRHAANADACKIDWFPAAG